MQQFIKTSHGEGSNDKLQEIELANATASILPSDSDSSNQSHSKRMQPKNVAIEYVIDMSGGLGGKYLYDFWALQDPDDSENLGNEFNF